MKRDCKTCEGSGAVDSGGYTPWGQPIDIKCPMCNGMGEINEAVWCSTPICDWEAISVIMFIETGEHLPVCGQCECAIDLVLNRLSPDAYDLCIVPIEDWDDYLEGEN